MREAFPTEEHSAEASANAFIGSCEAHIQKSLGINMRFVLKKHLCLFGLQEVDALEGTQQRMAIPDMDGSSEVLQKEMVTASCWHCIGCENI